MMDDCFCDYDPPVFYHASRPVARKTYRCEECCKPIVPGEQYERVYALWDYDPDTLRTCCRCLALRKYVTDHVPCFCWMHYSMIDNAKETICEYAHELPGLVFGMWRKLYAIERRAIMEAT